MSKIAIILLSGFLFSVWLSPQAMADHENPGAKGKLVLGWLETIVLKPWDLVLRAKLDTGANTSSIDAEDIAYFEKEGESWVRFAIIKNKRNDKPDHRIEIERPVVRTVLIREHFWESQRRPVVTLPFCLNGTLFEAQFNLVNRSNFKYPVLLGRRFLQNVALVDPDATLLTHTVLRDCKARGFTLEARNESTETHPDSENISNRVSRGDPGIERLAVKEPPAQDFEMHSAIEESESSSNDLTTNINGGDEKGKDASNAIKTVHTRGFSITPSGPDEPSPEKMHQNRLESLPENDLDHSALFSKNENKAGRTSTRDYSENSTALKSTGKPIPAQNPEGAIGKSPHNAIPIGDG